MGIGFLELLVVVAFGIPLAAFVLAVLFFGLKIMSGETRKGGRQMGSEEARVMQEIHQSLSQMEKRIESLETILLEKER